MLSDKLSLNLWNVPKGMEDTLNPLGCVGSNPVKESPCLELRFDHHPAVVLYPDPQDFREYAEMLRGIRSEPTHKKLNVNLPQESISEAERRKLVAISRRDPLAEISEQEKDALWKLRKHCLAIPDILPRFLDAVKWNSRDDLTDLYALLEVIIILFSQVL